MIFPFYHDLTAGNVECDHISLTIIIAYLTDSGRVETLYLSIVGNIDSNISRITDVGVDHNCRAVVADSVSLRMLITDNIIVCYALNSTAGNIERS